jgi:hypothetical protein
LDLFWLTWFFAYAPAAFTKDDNLVAGNVELLQRFANNFLRRAIAVGISGIPGIQTAIISSLEKVQGL